MSRSCRCTFVCAVLAIYPLRSQTPPAPAQQNRLPIQRVVLYKNGVGYFEHLGKIRGSQQVAIPFTSGQLDDVLKSLTVLDLDGGGISGVAYGSAAPVDRRLGDLRLSVGEKTTLTEFLASLRGARIEIRSGAAVASGRLLSVERKTRMGSGATLEVDYVSLLTDAGELKTTEISPQFSVRLLEPGLATKVERYLDIVSAAREPDVRRMVISTDGTGERSLFVSYISEVPVWKTTYRIVLGSKAGKDPLLQGWAVVDNTTGQDWDNVQLSLVAGAPQSFVQKLSTPYYSRRPLVPLPEDVALTPQTYESTLVTGTRLAGRVTDPSGAEVAGASVKVYESGGTLAAEVTTDSSGRYGIDSLPEGTYRVDFESPGFRMSRVNGLAISVARPMEQNIVMQVGSVAEAVEVTASAPTLNTEAASLARTGFPRNAGSGRALGSGAALGGAPASAGNGAGGGVGVTADDMASLAPSAAASPQELGDLFEYRMKQPMSIPRNRSALVPIVQSSIAAEKVSVWNDRSGRRPQRALWLNNTSGLTLDGGTFSILEDEAFAGEGIFEPIRPGERRLISYATDLALNASSKASADPQRVTHCRISRGGMVQTSEVRETKTYTVRNEDTAPRTVIVEHPVRRNYQLRGGDKPVESTAAWMRFRLEVAPKQTATLAVNEVRPVQTTYLLTNLTPNQLELFVRQRSVNPQIEEALQRVLAQKAAVADLESKKEARDGEQKEIFDDQQRLRENMKALRGTADEKILLQRYTQQLNDQETRLENLRKEIQHLDAQITEAQSALDRIIQQMSFDADV